jgi:hypothetical protein
LHQSIIFRKYRDGDEKGILELGRICFFRTDSNYWKKHWIWQYKENPLGNYIWVAEHNNKIIAHNSFVPLKIKVGEKIFKSAIGADVMTHPNYRRKKLFTILRDHTIKGRENGKLYFTYAFPGEILSSKKEDHNRRYTNNAKRYRPEMIKPIIKESKGTISEMKKNSINENLKVKRITQFDERINDFWRNVSRYFSVIVERKREYLNWRFIKRPNSQYFTIFLAEEDDKILGYIICFSFPKSDKGYIVDLLVDPSRIDVFQRLLRKAVEEFRNKRVRRIFCRISKKSPYYEVLGNYGFMPSIREYWQRVFIVSPSKMSQKAIELIKNPENWYLTLGDEDGILVASNPFKLSHKTLKPGYYFIRDRLKEAIRRLR